MNTIITENDESQWSDETGVAYHFPKRYAKLLPVGARLIYYKGKVRNKVYSATRLSDAPHYFATAVVSRIIADPKSDKGDLYANISEYKQFQVPVLAKQDGVYLEVIPKSRELNYWRDGVRVVDKVVFDSIIQLAGTINGAVEEVDGLLDLDPPPGCSTPDRALRTGYSIKRDARVRQYVVKKANGKCEYCGELGFGMLNGGFYLEAHHIIQLANQGRDNVQNVIALCANHHRQAHYGLQAEELELEFVRIVNRRNENHGA